MSAALRRSFNSLEVPNYRRYFAGQLVSLSGNWMQMVAEMWLILELTGSGVAVGVTSALQFLPILLFGAWGGVLADRFPKRSLLIATQSAMAVPALLLWGLTASGGVEPWMVFGLVFVRGTVNAIDNPTRQSFVIEMVGTDLVVNAVSLNSVIVHSARIFGPAIAGVLIATIGVAPCFLLNTLTFAAMIVALRAMDPARLESAEVADRESSGVLAAVRYVRSEPRLLIPMAMMSFIGMLAFNFHVLLPLLGRFTFAGGATAYTALAVAMAIGSVSGALVAGARGRVSEHLLVGSAAGFGAFALLASAAPTLGLAMVALIPLGAASVTFAAGVNSTLQLEATPAMRGRVMALYSVVFLGSTPIGGPIVGYLSEVAGPRAGLVLAGVAAIAAAIGGWIAFARLRGERRPPLRAALSGLGGRWWWWLNRGGTVAIEARGANQPQRLERRRGLDVKADAVALLDRGNGVLASTPSECRDDRIAGADRGDLRPDRAGAADDQGERSDRPQPHERDPSWALRRQAGRGPRTGEHPAHRRRGTRRASEPEADRRRRNPPAGGHGERGRVDLAICDDDADGAEHGGNRGGQQDGTAQEIGEQHQRSRRRNSAKPSGPSTATSASL